MSKDMTVPCEDGLINLRVGAIILKDGKVLMAGNNIRPEYLYTVGGRLKFGETAEEAVIREVYEETGVHLSIDRLGFVEENYFYCDMPPYVGKLIYETVFFFYMKVPEDFEPVSRSFTEGQREEYLTWISPDDPVEYYPKFFRTELAHPENKVKHFVADDRKISKRLTIRQAEPERYEEIRAFYHSVIDGIAETPYGAGWIKDVYPAPEYLRESLEEGTLYIGELSGQIVTAMIMNHACNDGYRDFEWPTEAAENEVTVIHALGVHPSAGKRGIAKEMVRFAVNAARNSGQKAIRLDVLKGNLPAEKLYAAMGFQYLHTLKLFYEDTGWTDYELYEYRV